MRNKEKKKYIISVFYFISILLIMNPASISKASDVEKERMKIIAFQSSADKIIDNEKESRNIFRRVDVDIYTLDRDTITVRGLTDIFFGYWECKTKIIREGNSDSKVSKRNGLGCRTQTLPDIISKNVQDANFADKSTSAAPKFLEMVFVKRLSDAAKDFEFFEKKDDILIFKHKSPCMAGMRSCDVGSILLSFRRNGKNDYALNKIETILEDSTHSMELVTINIEGKYRTFVSKYQYVYDITTFGVRGRGTIEILVRGQI